MKFRGCFAWIRAQNGALGARVGSRLCHQLGRATPAAAEGQGPLIRPFRARRGKSLKTTYTGGTVRNSSTTTTTSANPHFRHPDNGT